MTPQFTIQFSPTRLKQMKKIALSGSRAKLKILNGKLEEGFYLLKATAKKFNSFASDLADRIPQALAVRISLDLFSHFERKSSKRLGIPKGIVLGGVLALMCSLPAAGQVVLSTADAGAGTLREAITNANGTGANEIIILAEGTTYTISSNLPIVTGTDIGGTLQIISTGSTNAIINGNNAHRPITMDINSNLRLSKITITSGAALKGGGIYNNRGALTISNSLITKNEATGGFPNGSGGGIYTKGTGGSSSVLIQNSTISFNSASITGGGISTTTNNTLTISSSSIVGNVSGFYGGGIANSSNSPLTISSSSISGNTGGSKGGGIYNYRSNITIQVSSINSNQSAATGGAMMLRGSFGGGKTAFIQNTTISGNTSTGAAGGGIYHEHIGVVSTITLQHVTMSDNTGNGVVGTGDGFHNVGASTILFQNTIIANSAGTGGNDFALSGAALTSHISTGTIVEDGSLVDAGNVFNIDPLLGALTLNSGFLIHPMQLGSPALGAGANIGIATDQVGNARVLANPAIGAVEIMEVSGVCMVVTAPAGVTNTWIGCTNSDWQTATNWSLGTVPTVSDVVYVPKVAANDLIIDEVATCAKILVQFGAKCLVNYNVGGKLVVKF